MIRALDDRLTGRHFGKSLGQLVGALVVEGGAVYDRGVSDLSPVALAVADLLGRRAYALGSALADPDLTMRDTTAAAERLTAGVLAGDRDAGATILELAWPDSDPTIAWWSTPLGAATALATAHQDRVELDVAAAVLGVTTAAITADLDAGILDRHPDGGATLASVRARVRDERPEVC